jgi:hypothetical protein
LGQFDWGVVRVRVSEVGVIVSESRLDWVGSVSYPRPKCCVCDVILGKAGGRVRVRARSWSQGELMLRVEQQYWPRVRVEELGLGLKS